MPEAQQVTPKKKTRHIVKSHKDALLGLNPEQKHGVMMLVHKLLKDYKSVASKRGTKNFSLPRWTKNNI